MLRRTGEEWCRVLLLDARAFEHVCAYSSFATSGDTSIFFRSTIMLQEVRNNSSEAASETKLVSDQPIPPVEKPLWLTEAWHFDFLTTCTQRDDCFWDNLYEKSKKIDGSTWDLDRGPELRSRKMSLCSCLAPVRNACGERNESLALVSLAQLFKGSWIASLSLTVVVEEAEGTGGSTAWEAKTSVRQFRFVLPDLPASISLMKVAICTCM